MARCACLCYCGTLHRFNKFLLNSHIIDAFPMLPQGGTVFQSSLPPLPVPWKATALGSIPPVPSSGFRCFWQPNVSTSDNDFSDASARHMLGPRHMPQQAFSSRRRLKLQTRQRRPIPADRHHPHRLVPRTRLQSGECRLSPNAGSSQGGQPEKADEHSCAQLP